MQPAQTVLVLDFGSQFTQLIARRIRDHRVYSVVHPCDLAPDKIRELAPTAIILSGGPQSVYAESAPYCSREVFELGVPILGICYGMQLTAYFLGGNVEPVLEREYGRAEIDVIRESPLFTSTPPHQRVWASHGDSILAPPPGFEVTASSSSAPIAAFENRERDCYGIQFHPEVTHTEAGGQILKNFLFDIAKCEPTWDLGDFRKRKVDEIRKQVGDRHVIAAVSGGVDSSVAALLVGEAIGDQLTAIFVDNGVLRKHEAMQVVSRLSEGLGMHIVAVDARERFYEKLAGIEEPETKRKRIGNEFIAIFEEEAKRIPNVEFLVQGTLYPDVIESVSIKGPSSVIKTHHNVGGLPEKMGLKLIEPVRELFKDEVRQLGDRARTRRGVRLAASVPRARPRRPYPRRSQRRARRDPAERGRDRDRRDPQSRPVSRDFASLRCPFAGAERRRHGRRAHLRECACNQGSHDHGLHDRGLVPDAARPARSHGAADRERGSRRQSRRLRRLVETSQHDRMGMSFRNWSQKNVHAGRSGLIVTHPRLVRSSRTA